MDRMIEYKMGDRMPIPINAELHSDAKHFGKVVWMSENGQTMAVSCEKSHNHKKVVFIVDINSNK
jgi:hypothetical protein